MKYRHGDLWKNKKVIRIARSCQSFLGLLPEENWLTDNGQRGTLEGNKKLSPASRWLGKSLIQFG
jgi:hypothetical protein